MYHRNGTEISKQFIITNDFILSWKKKSYVFQQKKKYLHSYAGLLFNRIGKKVKIINHQWFFIKYLKRYRAPAQA